MIIPRNTLLAQYQLTNHDENQMEIIQEIMQQIKQKASWKLRKFTMDITKSNYNVSLYQLKIYIEKIAEEFIHNGYQIQYSVLYDTFGHEVGFKLYIEY